MLTVSNLKKRDPPMNINNCKVLDPFQNINNNRKRNFHQTNQKAKTSFRPPTIYSSQLMPIYSWLRIAIFRNLSKQDRQKTSSSKTLASTPPIKYPDPMPISVIINNFTIYKDYHYCIPSPSILNNLVCGWLLVFPSCRNSVHRSLMVGFCYCALYTNKPNQVSF
jgi:hypothetical protein